MCDMTHSYMCHDSQITDTMMTIVREEGFLALFLGAGHRMVWMALRGAVFFRCAVIHPYVTLFWGEGYGHRMGLMALPRCCRLVVCCNSFTCGT